MRPCVNRRQFIQGAAAAGLGYWVAGGLSARGAVSANEKLSVAIIGTHNRAADNIKEVARVNTANIVALCDVDENLLADTMGQVPVLVLPCLRAPGGLGDGNQAGLWGSLLPAAWSYMLAARTRGLGTAWTTLHLKYESEVAEILGLPSDVHQGALIPTAYYTGADFKPAPRQPLDEVLHIDRW